MFKSPANTIWYLACGNSMKSLFFEYLIGTTTLSEIIEHTCKKEDWINIAKHFFERTQFPNCLSSTNGKHIRIERPENTGSEAFNYKTYYYLILIADADYCFTAIDIGAYGSNSDSSVFKNSNFGKKFLNNQMHLPEFATLLDYEEVGPLPFVFKFIIKQRVYNYRLSYARRTVECAFGIMTNKWRILHRPIDVKLDFCDHIIKACCILHNFVRQHDSKQLNESFQVSELQGIASIRTRSRNNVIDVRNLFADYFTSTAGALSWQYENN
ncbi:hypothetical protein K1T71_013838 [Dendrolimus kikuchii]|uniref:Uncharacterized protein n=1 Tax=Dendrolimus kikuchii TaxID=765133 RepID=A0ACC1CG99_9NEOP|nr:hypothetical protein K1T71_013838 [Dendrolimus kikuchii]